MDSGQRELVVAYASKVIVTQGVKALKMDDVAGATRTSKRTLYETFGDKEELIFLATRAHFDKFNQSNIEAAKNANNILIAMVIVMEQIRKNAEVNWNIRRTLSQFYPKVSERLWTDKADVKRKIIHDSIKMGIKQGYIDKRINIQLTMNMFSYIAIGVSQNNDMIEIPSEINVEDAFQEVLITYIRGISTIKGIEAIDAYLASK